MDRLSRDYGRKKNIKDRSFSKMRQSYNLSKSPVANRRRLIRNSSSVLANMSKSSSIYGYDQEKDSATNPSLKSKFHNPTLSPVYKTENSTSKNKSWDSIQEAISVKQESKYQVIITRNRISRATPKTFQEAEIKRPKTIPKASIF